MSAVAWAIAMGAVALGGAATPIVAQQGATDGQWRAFAADAGATKYSPLDQITRDNVGDLRIAWSRPGVDQSIVDQVPNVRRRSLIGTPLMVDGVLYSPNGVGLVEAFDPGTGETLWIQEPMDEGPEGYLAGASTRGVAYWTDGTEGRILVQRQRYLYALDALTGQPYTDFGDGGRVDLTIGLQEGATYRWGGAPTVVRDVVVLGQSMTDTFVGKEGFRGDVRGFDVRTGELRWLFHTISQPGEVGDETWEDGSWAYTGHAPVWSLFSADADLGYVYMPVTSSTSDMYGGHRLGDNLFSQSLVAVDAETGEYVWHYQLVHHGLWDYDPPTAPILMDLVVDGRPVRAVTQLTKQAFAFVFDRVTGEPVWPIEERVVPQSQTPGERTSPTQPFPTKPPAFDRQGSTEDNLIDFTPELRAEALEIVQRYTTGPLFTPPTVRGDGPNANLGTIQLPGSQGGADVQGAAFDPETNMLYVPSITAPFVADIIEGDPDRTNLRYLKGTRRWIGGPQGLPLFKPPYGRITAFDMNAGEIVWQVPNGDGPRNHPAIRHLDLGPLGNPGRPSPLATGTLLFIGETAGLGAGGARVPPGMPVEISANYGEPMFRAYDKASGDVVWEMELPARMTGAPMTYMHEGKQYIVVQIGSVQTGYPGALVAYTLP
ncbi:MAG: PQQ-binding-like beta-propeller repeat protein [Gemmatimonadetes bacterium]|nr:PQQ-binding-like beta-propeller repeat protein [Gemmatimonadota bacterium]